MNKATLYKTQIFAYIGYLVCAEHTYEEENKAKIREENTGTGYLNNPTQIYKRKFAAFEEFSLSDKTIRAMPKKVKGASLATEDKLRSFDLNFTKQMPKVISKKFNLSLEESATKIQIEPHSRDLQKMSQTIQKLENRLTHTNKKMTAKEARSEVTYINNVNLLKKADAIEKSVSGNSYFGQIFAEAELISRRCTDDKSKFCSRGFMDFEMARNFAENIEIFNSSAFSEQSVFKQWRRQSNFNVVAYNMSIASQLDASAREILMPAYSSRCFQCIYYNKSLVVKYLSTHIKPKAPKNCNNTPLSSAQNLLLLILDETMDAMDRNASAANTESTEHNSYIHDYIRFLRCIIYGKEFERQGNFNPVIKLLLSYMIEFVFWIEERIRLLSMQKTFDENDIKHITDEYNFLKAVIYRYQVLCGLKIIQMQSNECRAKLAEAEWSFTVEMYTNENNLIALNVTDNLCIAEKNLKQDIMTLRTHIQDSIKNQASNQYIFYSEAMRIFYYPRYIEKVTRMCGFIYFILAFTQKCGIAIANMMGKYPEKRKNTCIQRLMHDSAEFRENTVLTLQLVCEYLSHGKCDYNDIALVYPDGIRAYIYSIDPMNPKTVKFEEIPNVFSYLYEKIRYIVPE